ncbi:MAG TPA: DUF4304 domain-containing protein [Gammaproteobacteria bacterium]|nr:DUF4304 domain-containing protein [Gammaproteobacteria bacterium]
MNKRDAEKLRANLVDEVGGGLTNVFVSRGFRHVPLPPDEADSELRNIFPLGRLKRQRGDCLDVIEFQFDKYGRPKFVINFGVVPAGGVTLPWGDHLVQSVADVSALSDAYRLYSSAFRARWFELGWLTPKNEQALSSLVAKAIALSNEINLWFERKTVGKHMKRFGHPP